MPNILTWIRIAAIPLVILAFYAPYHWANVAACVVFAAAGITDTLDGYLARKLGQITRLGAFLDPVADKLIVATALVLLVSRDMRPLIVLMAIVIIGREIAISALREWMAELGQRRKVAVSLLGQIQDDFSGRRPVDDVLSRAAVGTRYLHDRRRADGAGGGADPGFHALVHAGRVAGFAQLSPSFALTSRPYPLQFRLRT